MTSEKRSREIHCSGCGQDALVRAEPVYEGFKKIGEVYCCTACGKRYASEETTPFLSKSAHPQVFTEADRPTALSIFADDERQRSCGWCKHMVVNPFGQRCGVKNRFTDATDLCEHFEKKAERI